MNEFLLKWVLVVNRLRCLYILFVYFYACNMLAHEGRKILERSVYLPTVMTLIYPCKEGIFYLLFKLLRYYFLRVHSSKVSRNYKLFSVNIKSLE